MTTSGTTAFTLSLDEVVQEAYDRAGVDFRGGYQYRTARRSLDILMQEWSNKGLNLWTVVQGNTPLVAGVSNYTLPVDTVDIIDHVLRTNAGNPSTQADLYLNRITVSTYAQIPNKLVQGRPLQIYVDRQTVPQFNLWPTPDASQAYQLNYWRLRKIQDTGTPATNTMDVPSRFLPALVAGLAYNLAMKEKDPRTRQNAQMLKDAYDEQWALASGEDRDRSSFRFVPWAQFRP